MSAVVSLRLEPGPGPATPSDRPRLSWIVETDIPGWRQSDAELSWVSGGQTSGVQLEGDQSVLVEWPFPALVARQQGTLRVRVAGPDGWTDWSEPQPVFASFLAAGDWSAEFIGLPEPTRHAQPVLLRHRFEVAPGLQRAILYATAQGAYEAELNQVPLDDQILKPGWTAYQHRLIHESTDVTQLLQEGENHLGVVLSGGWFTEKYGFQGLEQPFYGTQPSFAGQLLLEYQDGRTTWLRTGDPGWEARGDSAWISAGIYAGEHFDARGFGADWASVDTSGWVAATVCEPGPAPSARNAPEVRVTETVPAVAVSTSPTGATLVDFGQNLVGRVRLQVSGPTGTEIVLRHAEVLEAGELGIRPLRQAAATDRYVLAGTGLEEWAPRFTFHGFRYVEVSGWPGQLDPAALTAEVIGSDMERTGWFDCSDPLVSRLHENVVWGMRGNFLYLPTDCPQRDERLGWTGDIQVFSPTASYLFDCDSFLASWLEDLALEQFAAGGVPFIVPDVLRSASTPAAAWGDAAVVVPWVLYQRFGDVAVLRNQFDSMRAWVDQLLRIAGGRHLWEGGFQFGDWLDPDAPAENPARGKTDPDVVASAYLFVSTKLLAQAAGVLGEKTAGRYAAAAELVRQAWLAEFVTPAGRVMSDAQTGYALALAFDLVTEPELRGKLGDRLSYLVRRDGYRIQTGFVGTPIIADALTQTGHLDQAGRMLQQTECPSWLYPVTMGATTVWERWDSLLEDGSINPGEMTSFNHYAFGAIADWLHRVVAGLAPAAPGYRRLQIAPQPLPGLQWANTSHRTPYGWAAVGWRREDGRIRITAKVPANTSAQVLLPDGQSFEVASGSHEWEIVAEPVEPPVQLTMDTSLTAVIDDPQAYDRLLTILRSVDPEVARDFTRRTNWAAQLPLRSAFTLVAHALTGTVEERLTALGES